MGSGDGTQAFESAPTYGDSLTGRDSLTGADAVTPEPSTTPPAQSTAPDLETLRTKVAEALAAEDSLHTGAEPAGETPAESGGDETPDAAAPDASAPAAPADQAGQEGRGKRMFPRVPGQLLPAMLRRRQRSAGATPLNERITVRKPSNASAGMFVALVLLIVFVLVAIQFVVSFVDSVAGLFS